MHLIVSVVPGAMGFHPMHEVPGGLSVVGEPMVVKPNGIGENRVAKEDTDLRSILFGAVRATEHVGLVHLVAPAAGSRQDALVRGNPRNVVVGEKGNR
jgi:hypothetical protein